MGRLTFRLLVLVILVAPPSAFSKDLVRIIDSGGELRFDPTSIPENLRAGYRAYRTYCLECHGEERIIVTLRTGRSTVTGETYGEQEFRQKIVKVLRGGTDLDRESAREIYRFFSHLIRRAKLV